MSCYVVFEQLALLNWLKSDSAQSKNILTAITQLQVGREIFNRLTGQGQVEAYKVSTVLNLVDISDM